MPDDLPADRSSGVGKAVEAAIAGAVDSFAPWKRPDVSTNSGDEPS